MAGFSPDDQFQKVLAVASAQFKGSKIQVRFGPSGKMRFIIDEVSLKASLVGAGLEEPVFQEIFHREVAPLLEAIIRDGVNEYVEQTLVYRAEPRGDKAAIESYQTTLRRRAKLVEDALLVGSDLRARYHIKVSSKHARLRSYNWEIARKIESSSKSNLSQPFATLSFETQEPEMQLGVLSLLPFFPSESVGRSEFCTFDCDEGDLDDLIQNLQNAKVALGRVRKVTGNG